MFGAAFTGVWLFRFANKMIDSQKNDEEATGNVEMGVKFGIP